MSNESHEYTEYITDIISKVNRESASEIVIKTIKKLLITKKLRPGDRLPSEMELSESLGVSRGSVREAMKILSAYGIVNIKRGDGTYVADSTNEVLFDPLLFRLIVNYDDLKELKEMREIIELGIITLAIKYSTEEDIKALEEAYDFMFKHVEEKSYKGDVIIEAELLFHTALGKATKNKLVQTLYDFIMDLYILNLSKENQDENFGYEALNSHRPIIDAIINKDIEAGKKAIKHSVDVWKYQSIKYEE